ncbi:MAG: hypothetical protein Q3972_05720 [Corynebacterium sp.]|nr:hypothetical protein [Corynebacterium sp.]
MSSMKRFSTRVVPSFLAAGALLISGISAPSAVAMTMKEVNKQGCDGSLDAHDKDLYLQVNHHYNVTKADFFMFNAAALGLNFSQADRDNFIAQWDRDNINFMNNWGGFMDYEQDRGVMLDYTWDYDAGAWNYDQFLDNMRERGYHAAADAAAAGPGRLGVITGAYKMTVDLYWGFLNYLTNNAPTPEQMHTMVSLLRKEDVDATGVKFAVEYDLYHAALSGCELLVRPGEDQDPVVKRLGNQVRELGFEPGHFYNANVVRFPFTLLPAGSSLPGM